MVSLIAGNRNAVISDKRDVLVESKFAELIAKADVLGTDVRTERDRRNAIQHRQDLEYRRRMELNARIERLNRDVSSWHRARRIRAYVKRVADRLAEQGSLSPDSDEGKWIEWARRYADGIDPTGRPVTIGSGTLGIGIGYV